MALVKYNNNVRSILIMIITNQQGEQYAKI